MNTKRFLALVMALVMAFSLVVPTAAAVPTTAEVLPCGSGTHDTAKMTVYVNGDEAAVGSIDSNMNAKLVLNYGTYPVDGTITAYGQTEKKANMTEFTLEGTSNTSILFENENEYFPGLSSLTGTYYIHFVDAMDATATPTDIGDYTFKKATTDEGITLTAENTATGNEVKDVDDNWQTLKGEAFIEDSLDDGDSYISLAAGSYIALNTEKLIAAGTLKLDDFSSATRVQDNIDNAQKQLMLTTGTNLGYQILLKQGTRFKLGNSYADVSTDLLITMTGNAEFNADSTLLSGIYNNLNSGGKADLAKNMLILFSRIAGSVQSTNPDEPVVITFGTPTSSSSTSTDGNTTVETTVTKNEAGTNDVTTVETVTTTTTSTVNDVETKIVTETVTTTSSTVTPTSTPTDIIAQYSVKSDSQKVTTTTTTEGNEVTSQNVEAVSLGTKENTVTLNAEDAANELNLSEKDASANIVTANLGQLTDAAKATIVTEAVAQAQESSENVTVTLAIVATALNSDSETTKQYDVKPVVTTQVGTVQYDPVTVSNADLQGEFTIALPVPTTIAADGKSVKITHTSEEDDTVEEYISTVSDGKASVTISHFSTFELAPVESTSSSTDIDVLQSLNLASQISINLYVKSNTAASIADYTITYTREDGDPVSKKLSNTTLLSSGYYKIVIGTFDAKQMTEKVNVKITDSGNNEVINNYYSIQMYCKTVIDATSGTYPEKLVNLCKATLDYGTYSQKYFNYNLSSLANGETDYFEPAGISDSYAGTTTGNVNGVSALMSLNLKEQVHLVFYFKPNNDETLTVDVTNDNASFKDWASNVSKLSSGYTKVDISGIPSGRLNELFNVKVTCGGSEKTWSWSAMSFAYAAQNHATLGNVSKALAKYYECASSYFN